jgi:tetratricopeptide (TPR) repeat protein
LSIAVQMNRLPLKVASSYFLGQLQHARGDYAAAIEMLERVVAWLPGELAFERLGMPAPPSIFARTWLAFSLAETGAFAEALAHGTEALRVAETVGHPYGLYHGHWAVGTVRLLKGEVELAMPALERALRIPAESSMPAMGRATAARLGSAYRLSGRVEEARAVLEAELANEAHPWTAFLPLNACALADVYLHGGRLVEAEQMATRALDLARRHEQRGEEARAMWVLGEIAARRAPAEAEGRYRSAEELAGALGMRPLVAQCRLSLGRLHRRSGDHQRARDQLAGAALMFREMDTRFWLEQAEADLKSAPDKDFARGSAPGLVHPA